MPNVNCGNLMFAGMTIMGCCMSDGTTCGIDGYPLMAGCVSGTLLGAPAKHCDGTAIAGMAGMSGTGGQGATAGTGAAGRSGAGGASGTSGAGGAAGHSGAGGAGGAAGH
jgi:hypothetical protein